MPLEPQPCLVDRGLQIVVVTQAEIIRPVRFIARTDLDVGERRGLGARDAGKPPSSAILASSRSCGAMKSFISPGDGIAPVLKSRIFKRSVLPHINAVRFADELEARRERCLALDLGVTLRDVGMPAAFELDEESRGDGKPAQPDVAAVGDGFEACEHLGRQRLQPRDCAGIEGQLLDDVLCEHIVDQRTAFRGLRAPDRADRGL